MALDSDSDDNEIILASNIKHTQQLSTTTEPNDDDDFILKHKQITKKLSKSRRKRKRDITNDINNIDILSQQTNYSYTNEPLLKPNDNICNTPPLKKRKRNMSSKRTSLESKDKEAKKAKRINILNALIPKNTQNKIQTQNINIVSSDTNSSSQNTQNTIEQIDENNNQNNTMYNNVNTDKPYLFGKDTNEAMKITIENERHIDARIKREINENDKMIQKIPNSKERVKQMEEEHRKFIKEFDNNNIFKNKNKNKNKNKSINRIEEDRIRFENDNAFVASFNKSFKKNKTRKRRRNDNNNNNNQFENRNKRHKSDSLTQIQTHKPLPKYDPNDPFSISYPVGFTIHKRQQKIKSQNKRRKKYSKSNRISRPRNLSNISSQSRAYDDINVVPGSKLLDTLIYNTQSTIKSLKKTNGKISSKKRKQKKDPFDISKPIFTSPFSTIQTIVQSHSKSIPICTPYIKPKKKTNLSNNIPLSEQLDKLTENNMTFEIGDNNSEFAIFSKLPHSHKKMHTNMNNNEDIEETRTTNEDLQYLNTPQRFKYRSRLQTQTQTQNENNNTPKCLRIVSNMRTPKKKE